MVGIDLIGPIPTLFELYIYIYIYVYIFYYILNKINRLYILNNFCILKIEFLRYLINFFVYKIIDQGSEFINKVFNIIFN